MIFSRVLPDYCTSCLKNIRKQNFWLSFEFNNYNMQIYLKCKYAKLPIVLKSIVNLKTSFMA